ncbi:MAG: hypothetical protein IIB38_14630, partial [Candidatus Hydrogenedentes bacterium]|nr:hypothetical protein [Candidatus Hydrogenedentota bacterium]
MAISTIKNVKRYAGDGTTTEFSFPFPLFTTAELTVVIRVNSTSVTTLQVEITDYTVALAGDFATASVTMVTAPEIGETLTLNREQAQTQETVFINFDGVPAAVVERVLDRNVIMVQGVQEQVNRSIKVPVSSALTGLEVPDLPDQAGKLVRVNATEDGFSYVEIDLEVITQEQVTFLQRDMYNQVIDVNADDSPYTILVADEGALYRCDTGAGAITLNLPSMAAQTEDLKYGFVKQSGDANLVTVKASGSELISGLGTRTIGTRYAMMVTIGDLNNEEWFHFGTTQSLADINLDTFSGDASETVFELTVDPINENNTQIYFDGAYQQKSSYSISGTTLTFSEAPPNGTDNIEVIYLETLAIGVPADLSVGEAKLIDKAVTLAKMSDLAADRMIGRANGGGTCVPHALTA